MRELDVVSTWEKGVKNGGDLAFEDEFAVYKADFFLRHLSLSCAAACLSTIRCRSVVLDFLAMQLFGNSGLRHERVAFAEFGTTVDRRRTEDVVAVAFGNGNGRISDVQVLRFARNGPAISEEGCGRQRAFWTASILR